MKHATLRPHGHRLRNRAGFVTSSAYQFVGICLCSEIDTEASFLRSIPEIGGNWRAAGAGTAIVAGARFDTFTQNAALREALVRSAEVLGGCLVALVIAWLANQTLRVGDEIKQKTAP